MADSCSHSWEKAILCQLGGLLVVSDANTNKRYSLSDINNKFITFIVLI